MPRFNATANFTDFPVSHASSSVPRELKLSPHGEDVQATSGVNDFMTRSMAPAKPGIAARP